MSSSYKDLMKTHFISFLLLIFGVLALFQPPADPDFGWHLKYGEYFFNHQTVLKENVFSFTLPNYYWANSYWISEFIIFVLYTFTGVIGMSLVFSVFLSLVIVLIFSYVHTNKTGKVFGSLLVFIFLSGYLITVRPMFFSSLLFFVLVYILLNYSDLHRTPLYKYIPLIFLFWANMHADFILGLFILGLFTFFELLKSIRKKEPSLAKFAKISFIPVTSVFITLLNPYGAHLWTTLLKEGHPYQFSHIAEWLPVSTQDLSFFIVYVMMLGLAITSIWIYRRKLPYWYVFCVLFFCILSFRSVYLMRPLVILSVFCISLVWDSFLEDLFNIFDKQLQKKLRIAGYLFLFITILLVLPIFIEKIALASDIKYWSEEKKFPYNAVQFLRANPIEGKMLNSYGWGGYLIWQLPEHKTFIDGRMTSWRENGSSIFEEYVNLTKNLDQVEAKLNKYEISWVLDKPDSKLIKHLKNELNWEAIFEDEVAVIVKRP